VSLPPEERSEANILQQQRQLLYDSALDAQAELKTLMSNCLSVVVGVLSFALFAVGCGGKEEVEPAVATPGLTVSRPRAAIGSPLKLTYRFDVAPGARIDGDYWVFVHVLEPDGEQLWVDDHLPSVPTSAWQPGQKIEYTRTVFVPNYPYIGPAVVRLGLYDPKTDKRLTLAGSEVSRKEYQVASFEIQPQSENIFLIMKEGWHPAEMSNGDPPVEWQWTKRSATISFRNPRKPGTVYLEYAARVDRFTPPQQVTVRLNGQAVGTFEATSKDRALVTFPVTAEQFGAGDVSELVIDTDRTFTPGGSDTRELGIQVFHTFVEVM
jgi:hypothetical protein